MFATGDGDKDVEVVAVKKVEAAIVATLALYGTRDPVQMFWSTVRRVELRAAEWAKGDR